METAPLHNDIAEGPSGGAAWWLTTDDGIRIRAALWRGGAKGTILLFNGRTEYIEKYGRIAAQFEKLGYSVLTVDWRGQGLAERLIDDPMIGHVEQFSDYQLDVKAVMALVARADVPKPLFLIGHSMGGAIGMRALAEGLPVSAAVFSGPMWGLAIAPHLRPIAATVPGIYKSLGLGHVRSWATSAKSYLDESPFEDNTLTTDQDSWERMIAREKALPEVALAGPSMSWVMGAMREIRSLMAMPAPSVPTLTFVGDNERIAHPPAIHDRMSRWPLGRIRVLPGEHELMMEKPDICDQFVRETGAHFDKHA